MCAAAKADRSRASTTVAARGSLALERARDRAPPGGSAGRGRADRGDSASPCAGSSPGTGRGPRAPAAWNGPVSPSARRNVGLANRSAAMVETRFALTGPALQKLPAPCVGRTWAASGSSASRRRLRCWSVVRASVSAGPRRSVRPAEPTSRLPPVNAASAPALPVPFMGAGPSIEVTTQARCSSVWPGVAQAVSRSPPISTASPSSTARCSNS